MNHILRALLLCFITGQLAAQTPTFIHPIRTAQFDQFVLHPSPLGGFISTGSVADSVDLDPSGSDMWIVPINGFEEAFLAGYDDAGNYLWHKQISSTLSISASHVSFTEDGQFYVSGSVTGVGDVDPGPGVAQVSCNCVDWNSGFPINHVTAWYGKYTATGDHIWHEQNGNTLTQRSSMELHYSTLSHDLYLFGSVISGGGTVDFDPGPGTANITPEPVTGGVGFRNGDIYARLDSSGTMLWYRNFGGGWSDVARWDDGSTEYFYLTGASFGSPNIGFIEDHDPGPGVAQPYHPIGTLQDVFASKFDSNGDLVWCKFFFGGIGTGFLQNEGGSSVAVDTNGDAFVAGVFVSNYPNTPGGSLLSLVPYNGAGSDALLLKLDGDDGSVLWQKHLGSENDDCYSAICTVDDAGRVYISSTYHGTAELNQNNPSVTVTANGPPINNTDGYVACFDGNGLFQWSGTYGGPQSEGLSELLLHNDQLCVTGYFRQTADLDLGPGVENHTSMAETDPFFACFDLSGLALGTPDAVLIKDVLHVHPNPASSEVVVGGGAWPKDLAAFDPLGRRVPIVRTANGINVSRWANGPYILVSLDGRTTRLTVQH